LPEVRGKMDQEARKLGFISDAQSRSKNYPAPNHYKEAHKTEIESKQRRTPQFKWPELNPADKERINTRYKKVNLGPGSHEPQVGENLTMRKKSINIVCDREKREVYYKNHQRTFADNPAPNKYQKQDFVK
jgi:hypothetical protein